MLFEISQIQTKQNKQTKVVFSHLYNVPRMGKCTEAESITEVTRSWGKWSMGS